MDEVQIEIKDEFTHQELQFENNYFAASSIENTNILNEELHIKDQSISQLIKDIFCHHEKTQTLRIHQSFQ